MTPLEPKATRRTVYLLPPNRQGPGTPVDVLETEFGFAITVNGVLYVHVSTRADGAWEFIPFSAKPQ